MVRGGDIFRLIVTLGTALIGIMLFFQGKNMLPPIKQKSKLELSGKELAQRYCQMCHKFPEPDLLDKTTWVNSVLPDMGMRLGIRNIGDDPYKGMDSATESTAKELTVYPDSPMIPIEDWQRIVDYYTVESPQNLPKQDKIVQEEKGSFPFKTKYISVSDNILPQITLLKFDPKASELYVGDYHDLFVLNSKGKVKKSWKLSSPASDIEFEENAPPTVLTLGKMGPTDERSGAMFQLGKPGAKSTIKETIPNLVRPVNFATGDLDMDDKKDVVICSFGNYGGKLSWFEGGIQSKEHILKNIPGATRVELKDLNGDKKLDIVALMAQANEQIIIFYNKGNGEFEEKTILQFNPVHGVSYFEMADFNDDGYEDLLVTNGDNRDFSAIDKPYHGIRIYLNDGEDNFEESFFYPMYDCSKAMARDFDNDGDLDIVAISFFNSYGALKNPKESFVYLSNKGGLNFTSSFISENIHGKWLTMEVGDLNQDSLLDVVLGTCVFNYGELGNVMAATGIYSFPQLLFLVQTK